MIFFKDCREELLHQAKSIQDTVYLNERYLVSFFLMRQPLTSCIAGTASRTL